MTDSLESLLAQALKHAHKNKMLQADLCAIRIHQKCEQSYGNPNNWRLGGLVELVHRGPDGTLSNLGLFQESFYKLTEARKLGRFNNAAGDLPVRIEFVAGDHWLGATPSPYSYREETPSEILELQARFEELMEEFEEELG